MGRYFLTDTECRSVSLHTHAESFLEDVPPVLKVLYRVSRLFNIVK